MYKLCNYWTLDVQKQLCQMKEDNSEKVPSEIAISGALSHVLVKFLLVLFSVTLYPSISVEHH